MHLRYKVRLSFILFVLVGVGLAIALILYALRKNIDLYYTPSQLLTAEVSEIQSIRLGGIVKTGSFQRDKKDPLKSTFVLEDDKKEVMVGYRGVLPALFREGQGIIVQGKMNPNQKFAAVEVFAKHDESYKPPMVSSGGVSSESRSSL